MAHLELPALGRAFDLGTLYDCHTDQLIAAWSPWDDVVRKKTKKHESSWSTEEEDSFQSKCANLGIKGDLKLSLLGGMVKAEGSGSYIYDRKTTAKQVRVILKYSSITHREEMTMEQLMNVTYPDILNEIKATHFVAAIDYGVEAFFVFELSSTSGEKLDDFKALVEAIPKVSSPSGSVAPEATCKTEFNKKSISCKYHGDVRVQILPKSYEEAVNVCREIADFKEENSVPKVITLRKISELSVGDPGLSPFFPVNDKVVTEIEEITEYLHEVKVNCQDLKGSDECQVFCSLTKQIDNFMNLLKKFEADFLLRLREILPDVRKSNPDDQLGKLKSFINSAVDSPFKCEYLKSFISGIQSDLMVLNQCRQNIEESDVPKVVHAFSNEPGKLQKIIHDIQYEQIFCLALNFNSKEDSIVNAMRNFLLTKENSVVHYNSKIENQSELMEKCEEFLALVNNTKKNSRFIFVLSENCVGIDATSPVIVRYMCGGKASIYKAPPVPMDFFVQLTELNEVKLSWHLEEREDFKVAEYNILVRYEGREWDKLNIKKSPVIFNGLRNTEYHFIIEAVFQCGFSSQSCIQTVTTKSPFCGNC